VVVAPVAVIAVAVIAVSMVSVVVVSVVVAGVTVAGMIGHRVAAVVVTGMVVRVVLVCGGVLMLGHGIHGIPPGGTLQRRHPATGRDATVGP
jgi:hypothetical protein